MGGAYREDSLEHGILQAGFSLPKIRLPHVELPEMDLSGFNGGSEKEKLREALKTMDDLGISPAKLVRRAWEFLSRKETKEKLEKAAKKFSTDGKNPIGKAADETAQRISEKASEQIDRAADRAAETVKKKAAEELDQAAEDIKRQVTKER